MRRLALNVLVRGKAVKLSGQIIPNVTNEVGCGDGVPPPRTFSNFCMEKVDLKTVSSEILLKMKASPDNGIIPTKSSDQLVSYWGGSWLYAINDLRTSTIQVQQHSIAVVSTIDQRNRTFLAVTPITADTSPIVTTRRQSNLARPHRIPLPHR